MVNHLMPHKILNTASELLDPSALMHEGSMNTCPFPTVLHVINGEHFSGAERVQQLLGKRLSDFGYFAHFACVKPGKFQELCGLDPQTVNSTPMHGRFDLSVLGKLSKIIQKKGISLLHAHTPRTSLVTSLLAFKHRLPWVYHVHSPTLRDSSRGMVNRINGLIERFSIRNCSRLITVSDSLASEMRRLGVCGERLVTVPNGVPEIQPIDTASRASNQAWRLGIVALMRPRKGVEVALQAMQQVARANRQVTLELIGGFETPEYQEQILSMIDQLGLSQHVFWSGFTSNAPEAIRKLDALVLPSLYGEGMPMVVLEALAAAVPVVATSVEGTPEVIRDGVEGLLAKPANAESLANKMKQMLSNRQAWMVMSVRALSRHRSNYSDRRMAQGVALAYDTLLKAKNKHLVRR
jgi:glycosyltransferase involved in cell wall biosynthesis